jgi:hypothetical protein
MKVQKNNFQGGFTLVELMITVIAATILIIGISGIIAAGHNNFWTMFHRVNSDIVRNAYEARSVFDAMVRKSSIRRVDPASLVGGTGGNELYVYYYSKPQDMNIPDPDKYAHFYLNTAGSDVQLMLEQGPYNWNTETRSNATGTKIIAHNVVAPASGIFSINGGDDIRMILTLDNTASTTTKKLETAKITVTSTAIRHNK